MDSFDTLIAKLQAEKALLKGATDTGIFKGGLLVEGDAKRLCSVDTGRLRSSISTERGYEGNNPVASVGTNVEYAPYPEFGTGQRGDQTVYHRQDWLGQPPNPYLRPAMQLNIENIKAIVAAEVKKLRRY